MSIFLHNHGVDVPGLDIPVLQGVLDICNLSLLVFEFLQCLRVQVFLAPCVSRVHELGMAKVTMMYGIPSIIRPVNTMIITIGFWNMPSKLNDSRGLK